MYNVSFRSNYQFNISRGVSDKVLNDIYRYELKGADIFQKNSSYKQIKETGISASVFVSAPNKYDVDIETLLLSNGINFQKQTFDEAMDVESILNRICLSPYDIKDDSLLVDVDTKKLDELFKKNGLAYIAPNGVNGIGRRYEQVGEFLKTGNEIHATKVNLSESCGQLQASVIDGRHRFAYLRDMGIDRIPVSLDSDSYDLAIKYGLI